jgi:pyridoxamine 5'-phosphate oxidase
VPDNRQPLTEKGVENDPLAQFARWYGEAQVTEKPLPDAVALATATPAGHPSLRMVLLKGFDAHGFVFYTNFRSRKGRELARNPRAALLFYWGEIGRQVRIDGRVEKLMARESDEYFDTRPRGSQLSAWASPQSALVAGRGPLERRFAAFARKYPDAVPRPPQWGGYRLVPEAFEFWQGREDRLHDRILYRRVRGGRWRIERLAP